jgi:uncharacterized repeat protein (TIGR03803 family)
MIRSILLGAASLAVLMPVGYASAASETVLYSFEIAEAGAHPEAGLVTDGTGAVYGTTIQGGVGFGNKPGDGMVFKITPPASGQNSWAEISLVGFDETHGMPVGGLVRGADGALYGTTSGNFVSAKNGTAFKLIPPQSGQTNWSGTFLHHFDGGSDGATPTGTLLLGTDGALYGTTVAGGGTGGIDGTGGGTIFKLTPPASGHPTWTETVLHRFDGQNDGSGPTAGLIADAAGALYGTVEYGAGTGCQGYGCGAVFMLTPPAAGKQTWTERLLHRFTGGTDGGNALSTLVTDSSGALYGTTRQGGGTGCGGDGCGTVFRLTPLNAGKTSWHETILYRFKGTDGANPEAGLLPGPHGVFYGTTVGGGSAGAGTVFRLTPPAVGKSSWSLSVLHTFSNAGADGAFPTAGLVADAKGVLYGTTGGGGDKDLGTVFRVVP